MPLTPTPSARRLKGFTLIELLVVILVLGVLAAIATVGFTLVTAKARTASTVVSLRTAATSVEVVVASDPAAATITRDHVLAALTQDGVVTVHDGLDAASVQLGGATQFPVVKGDFSVGFAAADGTISETAGVRATLLTTPGDGRLFAQDMSVGSLVGPVYEVTAGMTPSGVLTGLVDAPEAWAAPGNVTASAGDGSTTVTWTAAPSATSYTISATALSGGAPVATADVASDVLTADLSGLTNGTPYLVTVSGHFPSSGLSVSDPAAVTPVHPISYSRLVAPDAGAGDQFGVAVAISGDTAIIGSRTSDADGTDSGAAYLTQRTAGVWSTPVRIVVPVAAGAEFGFAVAISGDVAIIGAPSSDVGGRDFGAAYAITRTAGVWSAPVALAAPLAIGDAFGGHVAVSGDTAIISATGDDQNGPEGGAVYLTTQVAGVWSTPVKVIVSGGVTWDGFGQSVAISDDTIVVGSYVGVYSSNRTGGTWSSPVKLTAPAGVTFYYPAALSGDTALVGVPYADGSGAAYVLTQTSAGVWSDPVKLVAANRNAGDDFGASVAISGDSAVVGAPYSGGQAGGAHLFTRSGGVWSAPTKLLAPDTAASDYFALSVGVSGNTTILGAPYNTGNGSGSGAAYLATP